MVGLFLSAYIIALQSIGHNLKNMKRTVFFVSDSTGITAETLGNALLSQFEDIDYYKVTLPFIGSQDEAAEVVQQINDISMNATERPVVFSTLSDPGLYEVIRGSTALVLDLFSVFLGPLGREFKLNPSHGRGLYHGLADRAHYEVRIDAVDFALSHDDGASIHHYERADLILVGVSRSGKTPTSIYLAMQFGIRTANYPLTSDDLDLCRLPEFLEPYLERLYGLTIEPQRLRQVRQTRRPNSPYASLSRCRKEVNVVEQLFKQQRIPFLDTSFISIEEIASRIMRDSGLKRRFF